MLHLLINWFNTTLLFGRDDRLIFYQILKLQLESGLTTSRVLEDLSLNWSISAEITKVTTRAHEVLVTGRSFGEALTQTNYFPLEESGLFLAMSDGKRDTIVQVLQKLIERSSQNIGFMRMVFLPNLYYLVVLSLLVFMAASVEDFVVKFSKFTDLSTNSAYQLSLFVNTYGLGLGFLGLLSISGVFYLRNYGYGKIRKLLSVFDLDSRYRYGSQFCDLAYMLVGLGKPHVEIIRYAQTVFGNSGYMVKGLAELRVLSEQQGQDFYVALGQTILPDNIAKTLAAMTRGLKREDTASAFLSVAAIQLVLCRKIYAKTKIYLQIVLLSSIGYFILNLLLGIFSFYEYDT